MANVTASIVVSFGSAAGADSFLDAVPDEVLNEEKTAFTFSDTFFFLVYKSANVTLDGKPVPTSGMVQGGSIVTRTVTEQLQFVSPDDAVSLSRIPSGAISYTWYGNTGTPTVIGRDVTILSQEYPAMCDVEYTTQGISYELIPPSNIDTETYPEWPILVVVTGTGP